MQQLRHQGERFGRLTLVEQHGPGWLVRCDCGTEKIVSTSNLGRSTKSCGCLRSEISSTTRRAENTFRPTHYVIMRNYRGAAKKRGMTWNISEDQFVSLINGDCHWCGVEPQPRTDKQFRGDVANGVDRVDNTRGYEPDNVVSCCSTCNRAKGALSEQEFLDWVYRVALHHYDQVRSSP